MNAVPTLVRREFWEHRGLWIAPLIVSATLILALIFSTGGRAHMTIDGRELQFLASMTEDTRAAIFGFIVGGMMVPQIIVMVVVLFFYLCDALYGERKDRSILFWKSLPVSDASTVLSKLLVALVVTPLMVLVISLVTGAVCYGIASVKYSNTPFASVASWNWLMLLRMGYIALTDFVVAALWYAPVAAFILMVSGWARRTVVLWVSLPPLVLGIAERWVFNTHQVADFVGYRMLGLFLGVVGKSGENMDLNVSNGPPTAARMAAALDRLNLAPVLLNIDLWLGIVAAVAFVLIAIRVRRYRDDTSG